MRVANDNGPSVPEDRHMPARRAALVVYMGRDRYASAARRRLKRYR